ncbi:MAG: membrane protein insertion efficiency factor YidD [Oscillospiraceae bacterium]|nr:membrane protein insertion efficiency factor YidD [Oscillospiraceae bacterium]
MKKFFIALIRLYKKYISPALPPLCRYMPTCSEYAMDAIERFGVLGGSVLAAYRFCRCNPFSRGGIDNVPEKFGDAFKKRRVAAPKE